MSLIGQNALKKYECCIWWNYICLTSLFSSRLLDWDLYVSSFMIEKFSLCFNKSFLVSLLMALLWICSIIIKLASLLKIWSLIAKWHEAGIISALYTCLWWLFILKLKPVSVLPAYCMWNFLQSKRQMTKFAFDLVKNCKYRSILLATEWICVLYL